MASKSKDRKFMKITIDEMYKSKSEHDNKFDPLVGAVLIDKNSKEIGRAFRRNLRIGDHAEYTLIERFLPDKDLKDSILYVTLEPCIVRQPPKISCAKRIVSARIKKVFFGTLDPNPKIQGKGLSYLQENDVEVDFFDLDLGKEIREANKDFIEQYDQVSESDDELYEEFEGPSKKEKEIVESATLEDLSYEIIGKYLKSRDKRYKIPSTELWDFFTKNDIIKSRESDGSNIPTIAGLLLFGKNPEDFLVQNKIKCEAHHGERTVTSDVVGSILLLPDKIKEFLVENMRTYTSISEFKRIEKPEYHWEAIREALINAIVHRDYNEGAHIIIQLLPDKLIIKSPGLPPPPLSLDKIRKFNASPYSRNPRIAETFGYMKLMEERGWGFTRMRDILLENKLPPPQFDFESGYFVVTFFAREQIEGETQFDRALLTKLNNRQQKLIKLIMKKGRITSSEYTKKLQISKKTANRDLNKLIELGILSRVGSGPNIYYIIKK